MAVVNKGPDVQDKLDINHKVAHIQQGKINVIIGILKLMLVHKLTIILEGTFSRKNDCSYLEHPKNELNH